MQRGPGGGKISTGNASGDRRAGTRKFSQNSKGLLTHRGEGLREFAEICIEKPGAIPARSAAAPALEDAQRPRSDRRGPARRSAPAARPAPAPRSAARLHLYRLRGAAEQKNHEKNQRTTGRHPGAVDRQHRPPIRPAFPFPGPICGSAAQRVQHEHRQPQRRTVCRRDTGRRQHSKTQAKTRRARR